MADKKEIKSVRITQRNPFKYYSYNGDEPFSPENKEEIAKFDEAGVSPSSIEDGCKLTIFEEGRFKKAILIPPYTFNLKKSRKKDELVIYKGSSAESDADVLNAALDKLSNDDEYSQYPKNGTRIRYKVLQDPYKDQSPLKRESYGSGNYYLNNGCKINILWIGYNSNTVFSKTDENNKDVSKKEVKVFPPSDGRVKIDGYYVYHKDDKFMYSVGSNFSDYGYFANYYTDYEIVQNIINKLKFAHLKHKENSDWKANFDKLALCDPDTEFCSLIPFVDFLSSPQTPEPPQAPTASETPVSPGSTASGEKPKAPIKITSDKSITDKNNPNDLVLKALTNFEFKLSIGTKPAVAPGATANGQADNFENSEAEELDEEFLEQPFVGEGENLEKFEQPETIQLESQVAASTNFSSTAVESGSLTGGSFDANSNSDGTVSELLASSPVTTEQQAGKYASQMVKPGFNGTPIYAQSADPRWNKKPYDLGGKCGDNSTVGSSGCGPTSMSMLINHWAAKGKSKFTSPHDMAKIFEKNGCRVCGSGSGISGKKIKDVFKETFGLILEIGIGADKVQSHIEKGIPCVIAGKGYNGNNVLGNPTNAHYDGGHFVCLTGVDPQGRVRVNDPGRAANAATEKNPNTGSITHFQSGKKIKECLSSISQTLVAYPVGMSV